MERQSWIPIALIAGLVIWGAGRAITKPKPTGTVPSYMIGTVPSGTPVTEDGDVLLRNRYTHKTIWVSYFDMPDYLAGDWVYA